MSELAKLIAAVALEKLSSPDPLTRQSWDHSIQRLLSAVEANVVLDELYFILRVSNSLSSPEARRLLAEVNRAKLEEEIMELLRLPPREIVLRIQVATVEALELVR